MSRNSPLCYKKAKKADCCLYAFSVALQMQVFNGFDMAHIKIKDRIETLIQSIWEQSPAAVTLEPHWNHLSQAESWTSSLMKLLFFFFFQKTLI